MGWSAGADWIVPVAALLVGVAIPLWQQWMSGESRARRRLRAEAALLEALPDDLRDGEHGRALHARVETGLARYVTPKAWGSIEWWAAKAESATSVVAFVSIGLWYVFLRDSGLVLELAILPALLMVAIRVWLEALAKRRSGTP